MNQSGQVAAPSGSGSHTTGCSGSSTQNSLLILMTGKPPGTRVYIPQRGVSSSSPGGGGVSSSSSPGGGGGVSSSSSPGGGVSSSSSPGGAHSSAVPIG